MKYTIKQNGREITALEYMKTKQCWNAIKQSLIDFVSDKKVMKELNTIKILSPADYCIITDKDGEIITATEYAETKQYMEVFNDELDKFDFSVFDFDFMK